MASSSALLVRYNEIGLKGGNRPRFEKMLAENLRTALAGRPGLKVSRIRGRALIEASVPAERLADAASRVFGVASISAAIRTEPTPEAIYGTAIEQVGATLQRDFPARDKVRFRVRTNRADKSFPMKSMEFDRECGHMVLEQFPQLEVHMKGAELQLEIDIRAEGTWVFAGRQPGPGGLPVGSLGKALCLLSGGIDSPVAAWQSMKRGVRVEMVSFYSFPHVGPQTREKIIRLTESLSAWQPVTTLHIVPFAEYQEAIRDGCPPGYRTVLYRRAMQRIASRMARARGARALITGESVGQVASQTLENLAAIEEASTVPVLRPLVTYDKQETIAIARQIGTFELSLLPAPDCCTVFQPERPVIYGRIDEALAAEANIDIDGLTQRALDGTERLRFPEA